MAVGVPAAAGRKEGSEMEGRLGLGIRRHFIARVGRTSRAEQAAPEAQGDGRAREILRAANVGLSCCRDAYRNQM